MHHGLGDDDGVRRPVQARGPGRRPADPPERRQRLRPGRGPRRSTAARSTWSWSWSPGHTLRDVIRDEAPMPPAQALALHGADRLGARRRPPRRPHPPRHQARERPDRRRASGGRVKVADFGLAKAVSADTQHTATGGVIIGTVSYLAPELVVDGTSDARADVYAAGVVLYELLTGEQAARGRVPDRGRLQARPRGRARRRRGSCPASRRTSTRWSPGPRPATAPSDRPTPACCSTSSTASPRRWPAGSGTTRSSPPTWPCPRARRARRMTVTDDTNAFEILPIAPVDPAAGRGARPARSFEPQALEAPPREPPVAIRPAARGRDARAAGRCCWSSRW